MNFADVQRAMPRGRRSKIASKLLGHYFFERSHIDLQDAVFSMRASRCLNRMFLRLLTGKYADDIRRANEMLEAYQLTHHR